MRQENNILKIKWMGGLMLLSPLKNQAGEKEKLKMLIQRQRNNILRLEKQGWFLNSNATNWHL